MSASPGFSSWEEAVQWLRAQPERRDLILNAYYDDPLVEAARRYWRGDEWTAIRALLGGARGEALDLGAGRGIASYALAREGFTVTALEPDSSAIVGAGAIRALAASEDLHIRVVQDLGECLPFARESFALAFGRAVMHHMRDLGATCREVFRVLKPGGRFVVVREHVISRRADLAAFLAKHPLHHLYGGENAFLLGEYIGALESAGFLVQRVIRPFDSPINYYPHTRETLREEMVRRAGRLQGASRLLDRLLRIETNLSVTLKLLSIFSRRPGLLYSFVCDKPGLANRRGRSIGGRPTC
ncbi:MAG: class I SAM-dependent methyltransferase [Polyangiaceae bacterium]